MNSTVPAFSYLAAETNLAAASQIALRVLVDNSGEGLSSISF
jgi:hypothetical protein